MYPEKCYFEESGFKLIDNDTFDTLKEFEEKNFDMIFAEPPYFLSNDGITCSGGKMVSVNKGQWDSYLRIKDKHKFNKDWSYRVLKDNGTIWISRDSSHYIFNRNDARRGRI